MKKMFKYLILIIYTLVSGFSVTAHSGPLDQSDQGQNNNGAASSGECNNVGAAIVGGIVGALVGGKKNRAKGALIGAAVTSLACIAVNARSQQTASAEQVNKDYEIQNKSLPDVATVIDYKASAPNSVQKGTDLKIETFATVVDSVSGIKSGLTETIELTPPDNQKGPKASKVLSKNGGGTFTQNYTVPFSKEVPGGVWSYKSTLFLDGNPQKVSTGNFTVI